MRWFSFSGASSRKPTGIMRNCGFFCISRATSAPASPAPAMSTRLVAPLPGIRRRACISSESMRIENRSPPVSTRLTSPSMIGIERGMRGKPEDEGQQVIAVHQEDIDRDRADDQQGFLYAGVRPKTPVQTEPPVHNRLDDQRDGDHPQLPPGGR